MISSLTGTITYRGAESAVIEVGGVGFAFLATATTLSELREGAEHRIATALVVREDSLTLFGFSDEDERDTFNILQSVSGIGPKIALAVLGVYTPDILRAEVAKENVSALQKVPGIGKKGAQRLILELAGKLGAPTSSALGEAAGVAASVDTGNEVIQALMNFGWSERDSLAAYEEARKANPEADISELLRSSLQIMNRRRV
ncbi:MAG: Holliday junction branch migration protein RuvA [Actinomycetaceae bacterium]|nr:Holliday junction branch migration protein RuvA [Actinomycetaceae bacterium]